MAGQRVAAGSFGHRAKRTGGRDRSNEELARRPIDTFRQKRRSRIGNEMHDEQHREGGSAHARSRGRECTDAAGCIHAAWPRGMRIVRRSPVGMAAMAVGCDDSRRVRCFRMRNECLRRMRRYGGCELRRRDVAWRRRDTGEPQRQAEDQRESEKKRAPAKHGYRILGNLRHSGLCHRGKVKRYFGPGRRCGARGGRSAGAVVFAYRGRPSAIHACVIFVVSR